MTTQTIDSTSLPVSDARAKSKSAPASRKRDAYKSTIEFRLIFAAAFMVFLLTSVIERVLPARWVDAAASEGVRKSVFEQAKESASIAAGYAFMG